MSVPADRNETALETWERRTGEAIRPLLTKRLIAEHRRDPTGFHSDALQRVLNYFRRSVRLGRYVVVCTRPFKEWRVARLTGEPGRAPAFVDDRTYKTVAKAMHALFLARVDELMREQPSHHPSA
jgi:branched-chain amino acid transport system permease protein